MLSLVVILVLRACLVDSQDFSGRDTINVKTVLFRESDACKTWWSLEDVNLLIARKMMQDLVPRKLPCDFEKLAKYIKMTLESVKTKSPPESAQRITLAAYDVLGGYLKTVGLPILNEAYYAGNVPYATAAEIHLLYGRIMAFLRTDGGSWSGPIDMRRIPTKVRALTIAITNTSEACNTLEVRATPTGEPGYMAKEVSRISIPYLDDNSYPNAVAVPLRGNSLFSLMSNCSANLLPKFYILAMRCLASTCFTKKDIITFNHQFYDWIISSVVPHVHETDRWYPGFGGVMRIIETMNQRGLASQESVRPDTSPSNNPLPPMDGVDDNKSFVGKYLIFIIVGALAFVLICCCTCYCITKMCFRPPPPDPEESNEGLAKTLVSIYCGVKDTIVGGKNVPPVDSKEDNKSSSKSNSGGYDPCGPFYSSSEEGETSAPSSGD